jgi:hypothetical protein
MTDRFSAFNPSLSGPATGAFEISADDGSDLPEITRALYVGNAGNLALVMQTGAQVTLRNIAAGSVLPLRVVRVLASGSTAGAVVGLY